MGSTSSLGSFVAAPTEPMHSTSSCDSFVTASTSIEYQWSHLGLMGKRYDSIGSGQAGYDSMLSIESASMDLCESDSGRILDHTPMSSVGSASMNISCSGKGRILDDNSKLSIGSAPMNVSNTDNGKTLDWNSERSSQSYDFVEIKDLKRSRWNEKENFKQTGRVGSGANGNCFLLERRSDRAVRVCKVTQRCMNWGKGTLEEEPLEAKILRDILPPHDRICRLRESIIQPQTTQLYFDFYSDGDLSTLIRQYEHHWETVPETFMWHAFMQLAEALAFTHFGYNRRTSCRPPQEQWTTILHGDIKPANIFLSPPNPDSKDPLCRIYPSLVLGDFGLARLNHAAPFAGTLIFQPPELPATSQKADVWAIGAILHCLAHYDAPVAPPPRGADAESWWWSWEARVPLPLDQYTWELHDCVAAALVIDPRRRMDALQLLKRTERMFEAFVEPFLDRLCEELVDWATYGDMWYDANDCTLSG